MDRTNVPPRIFLQLEEDHDDGLLQARGISHLLVELDGNAEPERELGYDARGNMVYRWEAGSAGGEAPLLDAELLAGSTTTELGEQEFDGLWNDRIDPEAFFCGTGR